MTNPARSALRLALAGTMACTAIALVPHLSAAAPVVTTLDYTGAEQTYTVPAAVYSVQVSVIGASGGASADSTAAGGAGAEVSGTIAVSPGEVLYVEVGGEGGDANADGAHLGGFNGGGDGHASSGGTAGSGGAGGGGATDIRACSTVGSCDVAAQSINSRLVVAGGGGGAGDVGLPTGAGGNGGAAGSAGSPGTAASDADSTENGGNPGQPGKSTAGGAGGAAVTADQSDVVKIDGAAGGAGSQGQGGTAPAQDNGGGGGGGVYGGGAGSGGASDATLHGSGGGGGGGSSVGGAVTTGPGDANGSATITTVPTPAPTVDYTSTSLRTGTSAAAHGTVNPNGFGVTSCLFVYGPTKKFGSTARCTPPAHDITGSSAVPVAASLTGLRPGTKYFVALAATGQGGAAISPTAKFTTKPGKPLLAREKSAKIKAHSAKLKVTIDTQGAKSKVVFEYGRHKTYDSRTKPVKAGKHADGTVVTKKIKHLKPGKKYHARAIAVNSAGTTVAMDFTFKTKKKH